MTKYINYFATEGDKQAAAAELFYPNVTYVEATSAITYQSTPPPNPSQYISQPFTVRCVSAGTLTFAKSTEEETTIYYSNDSGVTWSSHTTTDGIQSALNEGDVLMLKANLPIHDEDGIGYFTSEDGCEFEVEGNIMSLLYGDDFATATTLTVGCEFSWTFGETSAVTSAENLVLPATTLSEACYIGMFYNSTGLVHAPKMLPATALTTNCYQEMFYGCTSLVDAPSLPATTLAYGCYREMFGSCAVLVNAPELLATTMADVCYREMFKNCRNLANITCLATDISPKDCILDFLTNVSATGTFIKNSEKSEKDARSEFGIPEGWTIENYT